MRILFVTNYYPPCNHGWGYMQLCEEFADGLAARGHAITVLTSTYRHGEEITRSYPVHRLLPIDPDWHNGKSVAWQFFWGRRQRERESVACLRRLVADFRPDAVFVWHAIGLPRAILQAAEQLPTVPVVYYLAGYLPELPDEYIAYWQAPPVHWSAKLVKHPLAMLALGILAREGKPVKLQYRNSICVSDYVRRRLASQNLIPPDSAVIHNGVDISMFSPAGPSRDFSKPLSLLYAGRLEPDKGIHLILEALSLVSGEERKRISRMAIVGDGTASYHARLTQMVEQQSLTSLVCFRPAVKRDQMPALLNDADVLILPSALEALSRMMQEAMAMGLLVIGTSTGGSGELLAHDKTGLVFEPGNSQSLAVQLVRALNEPGLAARLAEAGRREVVEHFSIQHTIRQIEDYLLHLSSGQEQQ